MGFHHEQWDSLMGLYMRYICWIEPWTLISNEQNCRIQASGMEIVIFNQIINPTKWGPQTIAKLVSNSNNYGLWYPCL